MRLRFAAWAVFFAALAGHALFSLQVRDTKAVWGNVPPVPAKSGAAMMALGDAQFSYRMTGLMLQNLGNTGGESKPLYEYDYGRLGQWFMLADSLDPHSNFVPLLAAYYFGGTQKPEQLDPVIDYLALIGQRPDVQKWRWLAQAVYLSRFAQKDLDKAMGLAHLLAAMWIPGRPGWMRQMPSFVALQQGDKRAAYDIIVAVLKDDAAGMHPNEVNFMVDYVCTRVLTAEQAATDPLCQPR